MKKTAVGVMVAVCAGIVLGVSACNDNDLTSAGTAVDLSALINTYVGRPGSVALNFPSLTGSDAQGNTLNGSLSITPAAHATVVNGTSCNSTVTRVTLTKNGATLYDSTSTKYFKAANGSFYTMVRSSDHGDATYNRTSQDSFAGGSGSVHVGDSGNLGVFEGSTGARLTATWTLDAAGDGGSVFVISQTYSSARAGMTTLEDRFYLDAKGVPNKFAFRINTSEGTYSLSGNRN